MDREIRNLLERTTQQARRLLEAEFGRQFEGTFDILPDGTIHGEPGGHLSAQERFFRARLVAAVEHRRAVGESAQDSVANFLRGCAFTFLNRIVALRMLEARGIIKPSVSKGEESSGFTNEFLLLAPGLKSLPDKGYRLYIESLFDEIGREVGILFDRTELAGQFWPDRPKLLELLELLNDRDLESIWAADETIGWVYQYFNSDDERRQMRADSPVPRTSREMAVRNQFFTPRYVVEFLADNTLGRIWYEMRQGQTLLKERCRYMERRSNEHFLQPQEMPPALEAQGHSNQEEHLHEPVHVLHRVAKDPREIRILDPACGSGHFLLYCFDLLEVIYAEAWDAGVGALRNDYPDKGLLLRQVPELILRHNLHGIDIDPRAAQIGSLALWMRAQRAWQDVPRTARPPIRKTNIVIAEPMPGEADLLNEFCQSLEPKLLGQLVRDVFEKMKIAGDAGALLAIESDIADTLAEARRQWESEHTLVDWRGQSLLFAKSKQPSLYEVEEVSGDFWEFAEDRLIEALRHFATEAINGAGVRRRLFADDAERGFAFVDVCRKRFQVVLMNPPFGSLPATVQNLITEKYSNGRNDAYAAFVIRGTQMIDSNGGAVGAITSRSFLNGRHHIDFREFILDSAATRLRIYVDLGWGVLDGALVETGMYVLDMTASDRIKCLDCRQSPSRPLALAALACPTYVRTRVWFRNLPMRQFLYWLSDDQYKLLSSPLTLEPNLARVTKGLSTAKDERFIRLAWEVCPSSMGSRWRPLSKGGEYSWFTSDHHLLLNWEGDGKEIAAFNEHIGGNVARGRQSSKYYFQPALTWSRRSGKGLSVRRLRRGCVFSDKSPVVVPNRTTDLSWLGILLSSDLYHGLVEAQCTAASYETGAFKVLPVPSESFRPDSSSANHIYRKVDQIAGRFETSPLFSFREYFDRSISWDEVFDDVDRLLRRHGLTVSTDARTKQCVDEPKGEDIQKRVLEHLSIALGIVFGRWDLRLAINPELSAPLPLAFDELSRHTRASLAESECFSTYGPNEQRSPLDAGPQDGDSRPGHAYPLAISIDGILVEDRKHPYDVFERMLLALAQIGSSRRDETIAGACDKLESMDADSAVSMGRQLFQDHLTRYSRSRRSAPVYWRLSSGSGHYAVWLYYHRLTKDTLYKILNDYLDPKILAETRRFSSMTSQRGTDRTTGERRTLVAQESFLDELKAFRHAIEAVAPLWNPQLDDGVTINFAPLWHLVPQFPEWQNELRTAWDSLVSGEYDWTHLAMHLWPERVVPKCATDRSLAIAHSLEGVFWTEQPDGKWKAKQVTSAELKLLVDQRSSKVIKSALDGLFAMAAGASVSRRGRGAVRSDA